MSESNNFEFPDMQRGTSDASIMSNTNYQVPTQEFDNAQSGAQYGQFSVGNVADQNYLDAASNQAMLAGAQTQQTQQQQPQQQQQFGGAAAASGLMTNGMNQMGATDMNDPYYEAALQQAQLSAMDSNASGYTDQFQSPYNWGQRK